MLLYGAESLQLHTALLQVIKSYNNLVKARNDIQKVKSWF